MKILKFKKIKNDKYELTLEDNSKIILYEDSIINNNLLVTKKINNDDINKLKKENEVLNCYYNAINYISYKMRSKKQILNYLNKKNYDLNIINKTIIKLENEKIINDLIFAKYYINDELKFTLNGPKKIEKKLIELGIEKDIIKQYLNDINSDIFINKINKIISKKIKVVKGSTNQKKIKLQTYIINLGYKKEDIINCLNNYSFNLDINMLKKEYNKLYVKYKNKYDKEKINYLIVSKLLQKGYTIDEIKSIEKTTN